MIVRSKCTGLLALAALQLMFGCSSTGETMRANDSDTKNRAADTSIGDIERFEIEGGPRVIFIPVDGTTRVAVQAMYDAGIVDEPRGIPQASHLIEHLACMGATAKSRAGETMNRLNQIGMANAETLPSLTHFDYGVPADKLEMALETEAERLRSLKFEPKTIAEEAAKCYGEVRAVSSAVPPLLGKFALMAANQAWRHASSANVASGLESVSIEELRAFHRAFYNRSNLTLIVAGSAKRAAVEGLVKKHFAGLPISKSRPAPIDWSKTPKRSTVRWDAPATMVYFAYPPPSDPTEQMLMTAALQMAQQQLLGDPEAQALASGVDSSGMIWPVGRTPGFVAFTLRRTDYEAAIPKLSTRFESVMKALSADEAKQMLPMLSDLPWKLDRATLKQNEQQMVQQMGSLERAHDAVLGNAAIQIGMREVWLGPNRGPILERAQKRLDEDWKGFLERAFAKERRIVTVLAR